MKHVTGRAKDSAGLHEAVGLLPLPRPVRYSPHCTVRDEKRLVAVAQSLLAQGCR